MTNSNAYRLPRIESVEDAGGGRLRVQAVRSQSACGRSRVVWTFLASAAAVEVERVAVLERDSTRRPWRESHQVRERLTDADRRELAALAGQALARRIRSIAWRGEGFTQ